MKEQLQYEMRLKEHLRSYKRLKEKWDSITVGANDVPLDGAKYRLGKKLLVDAKTETFKNDKPANALLTRPYRAPFVVPAKA